MPTKAASVRITAKVAVKPARATGEKRTKRIRMSNLEARRLESFKDLMKRFGGKLSLAGCDE
jgi:hypothetical protein